MHQKVFRHKWPSLTINGKKVNTNTIILNGRTLVSIRVIGENSFQKLIMTKTLKNKLALLKME